MDKMPWILPVRSPSRIVTNETNFSMVRPEIHISPPKSSLVLDESPSKIVSPNTQELEDIKNMILNLQLDLQEERCKRESLEEIVRKFEGNPTQKSHKTSEREWRLTDRRVQNE
jgi:hypothetical protein